MKHECTNQRDCVMQDRDNTTYCCSDRECGYKEPAEDKMKPFADLLEAAEEMYVSARAIPVRVDRWKAAIEAARIELERGKR